MPVPTIPAFYRIFFTIIDPMLATAGVILHLRPDDILTSYAVHPVMPPAPETRLLVDGMSGFFGMALVLQIFLLRARPNDVLVWKLLQAALMCTDVSMSMGFYRALSDTDRLAPAIWRVEEWSNIIGLILCGIIRVAFCLGVGLPRQRAKME